MDARVRWCIATVGLLLLRLPARVGAQQVAQSPKSLPGLVHIGADKLNRGMTSGVTDLFSPSLILHAGEYRRDATGEAYAVFTTPSLARTPPTSNAPRAENWILRHLVLVGAFVGTVTGGVIAANVQRGEPAIIAAGAVGGAYGGLIASAVHNARHGKPLGRKTKFGIVAGAIGAGIASLVLLQGLGGV